MSNPQFAIAEKHIFHAVRQREIFDLYLVTTAQSPVVGIPTCQCGGKSGYRGSELATGHSLTIRHNFDDKSTTQYE